MYFVNVFNKQENLSLAGLSSLVCLWVRTGAYPRVKHLFMPYLQTSD
jgi:hypothetical protein